MHLFEKRERFAWRGVCLSVLLFALLAGLFAATLGAVGVRADAHQAQLLKDAIRRAVVACYAIEGRYPPSVEYVKEHYGVVIDEDKYIVLIENEWANIMPVITVLVRGAVIE